MRESIGASWMLGIVVVFVFLFLFFLTYSINYTRAFNVKNEIINYIEHAEGYTDIGGKSHGVVVSIDSVDIASYAALAKSSSLSEVVKADDITILKSSSLLDLFNLISANIESLAHFVKKASCS